MLGDDFPGLSIRQVGRALLVKSPLTTVIAVDCDVDPTDEIRCEWMDEQLYDSLPRQDELDSLCDVFFTTLENAWPEGFDEVVFSDGTYDEAFARDLLEPYLISAEHYCMPLMTDFGSSQVEMEAYLINQFRLMIVQWRENVLLRLEKEISKIRDSV